MGRGTVALYGTTTTQAVCSAHTVRTLHAPCGYWMPLSPHFVTIQLCSNATRPLYMGVVIGCLVSTCCHNTIVQNYIVHRTVPQLELCMTKLYCHSNCATGGIHCAVNWHSTHTDCVHRTRYVQEFWHSDGRAPVVATFHV